MDSSYYVNESIYSTTDADAMTGVIAVVLVIYLLIFLFVFGFALANYIMTSLALHKLADRRQIPNPWMAWLPFASDWLIGNIVDDYDGRNGIKRKWRVLLLTMSLISVVGLIVIYIAMFVWIFVMAFQYADVAEPPVAQLIGGFVFIYVALLIVAVVATAKSFCQAICIYKIFESTVPEKSVKYLLLYLLVPLAGPICLLKCKDKGYPYPQQQEFVSYETPEVPEQDIDNM